MDPKLQQQIVRFHKKVHHSLWLRGYLTALATACFVMGVLMLAARWGSLPDFLLWLLPTLVVVLLTPPTYVQAKKRMPDDQQLTAALDRHNGAGGLVMALSEAEGSWSSGQVDLPEVRFSDKMPLRRLSMGGLFFAACALVPVQWLTPPSNPSPDLTSLTENLEERLELLEETQLLPEEQVDALSDALDRLREEGDHPMGSTWEAMDYVEARLQDQADQAAEELAKMQQQLKDLQALAEALEQGAQNAAFTNAMEEFNELMSQLANENPLMAFDAATQQALAGLSGQQQLKAFQKAMQGSQQQAQAMSQKLQKAGAKSQSGEGQSAESDLRAYLDQLQESGERTQSMTACAGLPGEGGVSRGRGDAPLTWQNPGSTEGTDFEEQSLPPSELRRLEESRLVGMDATAPEENDRVSGQFDALSGAASGSGGANTQTILPRHRALVRRFFQKSKE